MKKICLLLLIAVLVTTTAYADTFDYPGYYDFNGLIGKSMKVQMSLYAKDNKIAGSYIYDKYRKEIKLEGTIKGNEIILKEFDVNGKFSGTFNGKIDSKDVYSGTWTSSNGSRKYPFKLQLQSILTGAQYGHRYSIAGIDTDAELISYVEMLQSYISKDDKVKLSELIAYPVKVVINGKQVEIKDKKTFINNYNQIFNQSLKSDIINAYPKYLFANWQGVMAGSGMKNVWINFVFGDSIKSGIFITAINN